MTTAALTGRVTVSGAPTAGITVTVTSPALQHPRTTITGPRGTYWLGALPPGEYEVTFSLAGHTTLTRTAMVELARVARADARLEPNADEESVVSTVTTIGVSETTAITTHFDDATLDRLPLGRIANATLLPDPRVFLPELDGLPFFLLPYLPEDVVEQAAAVRGAAPVEYQTNVANTLAFRTRQGREDFFASLRDTMSNDSGLRHFAEATAGGRIIPERLWFFAAGWDGETSPRPYDARGANAKLHAQLGASHHLDGSYTDSRLSPFFFSEVAENVTWLQHTAVAGTRFTWETHAAHASQRADFVTSRASYVVPTRAGDHVLTAGGTDWSDLYDLRAYFVSDRWSAARWVVNAGVRYEENHGAEHVLPRIAATYDLRGNGRHALAASYGEYAIGFLAEPHRIATLGYAAALGRGGAMRADVLRRDSSGQSSYSLQLDGRYRMFDRFEAGATYSYEELESSQIANAWVNVELPLGEHELGVTVLQRYFDVFNPATHTTTVSPTDLALRYAIPFSRVRLTLAADVVNVFEQSEPDLFIPREVRFWVRLLWSGAP